MSNSVNDEKIIEACQQAVKDWDIKTRIGANAPAFVLDVIDGMHKLLMDREGTADLNEIQQQSIQKLQRELRNSDDTVKSLRTALADNNDIRQAQLLRLIEMLKLIVETPVTHGQKNGMILLVAEIAQRMSHHDLYLGDIPF